MTERIIIRERQAEFIVRDPERVMVKTPGVSGPAGVPGPQGPGGSAGPQGPAGPPVATEVLAQLVEDEISEYDEEGPSLVLLYENVKV